MNRYLGDLIAQQLEDGYHWKIIEPFTYRVGSANSDVFVTVPRGFVTDFASIPRGLWNLWPPAAGKHAKASVVHDVLYKRGFVEVGQSRRTIERDEADAIFKEAMEVSGVGWFSRHALWLGVRAGGWKPWGAYRKADHVDLEKAG